MKNLKLSAFLVTALFLISFSSFSQSVSNHLSLASALRQQAMSGKLKSHKIEATTIHGEKVTITAYLNEKSLIRYISVRSKNGSGEINEDYCFTEETDLFYGEVILPGSNRLNQYYYNRNSFFASDTAVKGKVPDKSNSKFIYVML